MIYRSRVGAEWGGDDHSVKAPPPPMANHALHAVDALLHGMAIPGLGIEWVRLMRFIHHFIGHLVYILFSYCGKSNLKDNCK